MHSIANYGKLIVRAVVNELAGELFTSPSFLLNRSHHHQNQFVSTVVRRSSFQLVTALSGISKNQPGQKLPSSFAPSFSNLKSRSFGDDSCFYTHHDFYDVLGVADGVGGWRTYGVDPSIFPQSLMSVCERMVKRGEFVPQKPVDLLRASYSELQQDKTSLIGSCTACIVALHSENNHIYTANLGDSGFMVIRKGKVVHRSEEQQHYFNTPYQLAVAPSVMEGTFLSDSPTSANATTFCVEEGDFLLLATDGLFDNLEEDKILQYISKLKSNTLECLQEVANLIVNEAHRLAFDPNYLSPFAVDAAANGFQVTGGKPDDVTVILARVTVKEQQELSINLSPSSNDSTTKVPTSKTLIQQTLRSATLKINSSSVTFL